MVEKILRVTASTLLKLRPEQSSQLTSAELQPVSAGSTFEIHSYAYADINGDFAGHIKVAFKDINFKGFNTWFIYGLHVQVEFDGVVVYPQEDEEAIAVLRVNRDTLLKQRPVQSSVLPEDEKHPVSSGDSFLLHSYAYADSRGDFSSHIKFAIRYPKDFVNDLSTWFIYDKHAYVELDGAIVYPPEDPNTPLLRITQNTLFKRQPLQSSKLPADEVYPVSQGMTWKLHSYAYKDASGSFSSHIKIALKYEKDYIRYLSTWYVYEGHAQVEIQGKVVYPQPKTSGRTVATGTSGTSSGGAGGGNTSYSGIPFKLPGNTSTFYTDQPIIPGGSFTWGEATMNATRIPETITIVNNIIGLAREMQKARDQIGRPFQINSWYRPPAVNAAVGGARYSQHLYGKAADIQVSGYSGRRVANAVMLWWPGGVGIYSNIPDIVHLDTGPRRVWGF